MRGLSAQAPKPHSSNVVTTLIAVSAITSHTAVCAKAPPVAGSRIMPLKIDTREVAHVAILDVKGRIVLGDEIGELRHAVRSLVADGKKKIILNLADADYIDSSEWGNWWDASLRCAMPGES